MIALHCLHTGAGGQTMIDINPICGPVLLCSLQSALIYTLGNYRLIISSVGIQNLVFVPCSLPLNPLFLEWKVQKVHFFIPFNVFARFLFVSFTVHNQIYSFIWTQIRHFSNCSKDKSSNEYHHVYFIISDWQIMFVQFPGKNCLLYFTANRFVENIGKVRFIFCSLTKFTVET